MDFDKWEQAKQLYEAALKCPTDKRLQFLDENCDGDEGLRGEVESLLACAEKAENFLERAAVCEVAGIIAGQKQKLKIGQSLAHYKIAKPLGAGGMGEVYLAEDKKLDRRVAVKILNSEFEKREADLLRFIREAKAASA